MLYISQFIRKTKIGATELNQLRFILGQWPKHLYNVSNKIESRLTSFFKYGKMFFRRKNSRSSPTKQEDTTGIIMTDKVSRTNKTHYSLTYGTLTHNSAWKYSLILNIYSSSLKNDSFIKLLTVMWFQAHIFFLLYCSSSVSEYTTAIHPKYPTAFIL